VIVIGAGPAGLGAAHQLTKLGAEVSWVLYYILHTYGILSPAVTYIH